MAYSAAPTLGINFNAIIPANTQADQVPFTVGATVIGNDGRLYVFGKASAAIAANTAVCSVNTSTFAIGATTGTYLSPSTAAAINDWLFVSKVLL